MLHTSSNPTIFAGAYTVIEIVDGGLIVVETANRNVVEITYFVDGGKLTNAEKLAVGAWAESRACDCTPTCLE